MHFFACVLINLSKRLSCLKFLSVSQIFEVKLISMRHTLIIIKIFSTLSFRPGVESGPVIPERLVKAKSEMALSTTSGSESPDPSSLNRAKSRSLEPLTGLAMWSSQSVVIELDKGDRGLGFSILDYQVRGEVFFLLSSLNSSDNIKSMFTTVENHQIFMKLSEAVFKHTTDSQ